MGHYIVIPTSQVPIFKLRRVFAVFPRRSQLL